MILDIQTKKPNQYELMVPHIDGFDQSNLKQRMESYGLKVVKEDYARCIVYPNHCYYTFECTEENYPMAKDILSCLLVDFDPEFKKSIWIEKVVDNCTTFGESEELC